MAQGLEFDIRELVLTGGTFGPIEVQTLIKAISDDSSKIGILRDAVGELELREMMSPADWVRLGVCQYVRGQYTKALEALQKGDGGALAHFYLGKAHFVLENFAESIVSYEAAQSAGYDADTCALARAEALRYQGNAEEAMKILDTLFGPVEQTGEYLYQRGATVSAVGGNPTEVVALYERAVEVDPQHAGALFGLAMENDRRGNDERALQLYERSVNRFPAHIGSLLNLGVLYEDMEEYEKALNCYQRILEVYPNHQRASLFLRDAKTSQDMYFDEEAQKRRDRLAQVLSIPVTDFELSVRSRNCLQKIGISVLGDLTRTSEQQLLTSKNFGETSLVEIREMLASKGLELGQFSEDRREAEPELDTSSLSQEERALLDRPIADLNLSVRARKCMIRLGIATIGELVRRTADEMLECKNFGVTSLNEVREKLTLQNLKMRGD